MPAFGQKEGLVQGNAAFVSFSSKIHIAQGEKKKKQPKHYFFFWEDRHVLT